MPPSSLAVKVMASRPFALAPRALDAMLAATALPLAPSMAATRRHLVTEAGIAIVPVVGPLVSRGDWLSELFGAASYGDVGDAIAAAFADPAARAVLLEVDSPGGEVGGLFDLVECITPLRQDVSRESGFGPDQPLDFHHAAHLKPVLLAMIRMENGCQPYTDAEIDAALARAGVLPPAAFGEPPPSRAARPPPPARTASPPSTPCTGAAAGWLGDRADARGSSGDAGPGVGLCRWIKLKGVGTPEDASSGSFAGRSGRRALRPADYTAVPLTRTVAFLSVTPK